MPKAVLSRLHLRGFPQWPHHDAQVDRAGVFDDSSARLCDGRQPRCSGRMKRHQPAAGRFRDAGINRDQIAIEVDGRPVQPADFGLADAAEPTEHKCGKGFPCGHFEHRCELVWCQNPDDRWLGFCPGKDFRCCPLGSWQVPPRPRISPPYGALAGSALCRTSRRGCSFRGASLQRASKARFGGAGCRASSPPRSQRARALCRHTHRLKEESARECGGVPPW